MSKMPYLLLIETETPLTVMPDNEACQKPSWLWFGTSTKEPSNFAANGKTQLALGYT